MKTQIIDNDKDLLLLKNFLRSKSIFAFDTETDGLSHDRKMIGFSLAVEHDGDIVGFYIPCKHSQGHDLFLYQPITVMGRLLLRYYHIYLRTRLILFGYTMLNSI